MSQFDHKVQHVDPSTGAILKEEHYIMKISQGRTLYQRPPKTGPWYNPDGTLHEEAPVVAAAPAPAVAAEPDAAAKAIKPKG